MCILEHIPFVFVTLFPGIIISGRTEVDFWLPIIFPVEAFYSFISTFHEGF